MNQEGTKTVVRSVSRAFEIITFIANATAFPSFTVIQKATRIPKSSLSNLLKELLNKGYIRYNSEKRGYYLTMKFVTIAAGSMSKNRVTAIVQRGVTQLGETLRETTHAAILDGRYAVFIAKHSVSHDVSSVLHVGMKLGAHATGCGKVLLAALSDTDVRLLLEQEELERYTDYTETSPPRLYRELKRIRKYGVAYDYMGNVADGICISAPVRDEHGQVIAAISASISVQKAAPSYLRHVRQEVRRTAAELSRQLGCTTV